VRIRSTTRFEFPIGIDEVKLHQQLHELVGLAVPEYLFHATVTELNLFFVLPSFRWSAKPLGMRVVGCYPNPFMQPKVVSFKH
jgi:hypothetical protein